MLLFSLDDIYLTYTKYILHIPFIHLSSGILSTKGNCANHKNTAQSQSFHAESSIDLTSFSKEMLEGKR